MKHFTATETYSAGKANGEISSIWFPDSGCCPDKNVQDDIQTFILLRQNENWKHFSMEKISLFTLSKHFTLNNLKVVLGIDSTLSLKDGYKYIFKKTPKN